VLDSALSMAGTHSSHSRIFSSFHIGCRRAHIPAENARRATRWTTWKAGSRPVAPGPEAVAKLSALRGPLPPGPTSAETVLHLLNEYGSLLP